jgi:hypothetical protein
MQHGWGIVLLGAAHLATVAPVGASEEPPLELSMQNGRLTVDLGAVALDTALAEVARLVGAELQIRGRVGPIRAQSFQDVPIGEAIRRIAGGHGVVLEYDGGDLVRPTVIRVYAPSPPVTTVAAADARAVNRTIAELLRRAQAGDAQAVSALAQLAQAHRTPGGRVLAVRALGRLSDEQAQRAVLGALADADEAVRLEVIRAIAGSAGEQAFAALTRVAEHDGDERVREAARAALAQLDEPPDGQRSPPNGK